MIERLIEIEEMKLSFMQDFLWACFILSAIVITCMIIFFWIQNDD